MISWGFTSRVKPPNWTFIPFYVLLVFTTLGEAEGHGSNTETGQSSVPESERHGHRGNALSLSRFQSVGSCTEFHSPSLRIERVSPH
ncbi:hypothetical protein INR49_022717 [Caranx melampygus]|nr:hypothetical protein INR49_022717 [Caranx melampygus]